MPTFYSLTGMVRQLAVGAALAVLSLGAAHAQVVPLYGFTKTTATYTPLTGGMTFDPTAGGGGSDDGYSQPQSLPFSFQFGFNTYTSYIVTTNGWITFGRGATTYEVPLNQANDQLIGFFAKDLRSDGPNTQYSSITTGTAPNRIHKIEAANFVQYGNTSATGSAQVWLFENGNIEIHYGSFNRDWTPGTTNGVQVGLRGGGVNDALTLTGSWTAPTTVPNAGGILPNTGANGDIPSSGTVFRFTLPSGDLTPPTVGAITVTPPGGDCVPVAHTISVTPSDNTGITRVELDYFVGGAPTPTTVTMTRSGNTFSATIPPQGSNRVRYRVRVIDSGNNALVSTSPYESYSDAALSIYAGPNSITYAGLNDTLMASSTLGGAVRITEVTLYRFGIGASPSLPAYVPAGAADFVELSNLGTGSIDISGYSFEVQGGGAARSYTFPNGVVIPGREVLLLHVGSGTDDPANNYYNTGGGTDQMFSGNDQAFVLTSPTGQVVDAVVFNNFGPSAPITSADWNGPGVVSPATIAGAGLYGPDGNDNSSWSDAQSVPQSMGALNAGLPVIASTAGIQWTGPNLPGPVAANPLYTPVFTTPGTYSYVASVSNGACTVRDTVVVTVLAPTAPTANFYASNLNPAVGDVVFLYDQSLNRPANWSWRISPNSGFYYFNPQHDSTSRNPWVVFTTAGTYSVTLVVSNGAGQHSFTRTNYIVVGDPRYCQVTGDCSVSGFIDAVTIVGTNLRNRGTACTNMSTGYTSFPATDSTTAELRSQQIYTMQVTGSTTGTIAAWIDYDNNDEFNDSTEFILVVNRPNPMPGQPASVQFTVPDSTTAVIGVPIGMRIRNRRNGNLQPGDACTNFLDGETEDYVVTLLRALPTANPAELIRDLAVYPNPSTGVFRVNLKGTGARHIQLDVTDALGRVVHRQTATDNTVAELRLQDLSAGIYFLRIQLDETTGFRRIEIRK